MSYRDWFDQCLCHQGSAPLSSWVQPPILTISPNLAIVAKLGDPDCSLHEKLSWPLVHSDKWLTKPTSPKPSVLDKSGVVAGNIH